MSASLKLLTATLIAALAVAGCGKKKTEESADQLQAAQTSQGSGDKDIFDEFYEDEGGTKKETPPPEPKEETFSTSRSPGSYEFTDDGRYVVQVSCVRAEAFADELVRKLEAEGFPAYVAQVENPTPELMGRFYRVRIGGFRGVSEARDFGEDALVVAGREYWVDNKSNDNVGMEGYGLGQSEATESYYTTPDQSSSSTETSTESSDWSSSTENNATSQDSWGATDAEPAAAEPEPAVESTPEPPPPAEPVAAEPVASEPASVEPAAAEPAESEPVPAEPEAQPAAEETASEPAAQPPATEPAPSTGSSAPAKKDGEDWGDDWGDDSGW